MGQSHRAYGHAINRRSQRGNVVDLLQLVESVEVREAGPAPSSNMRPLWIYAVLVMMTLFSLTHFSTAFNLLVSAPLRNPPLAPATSPSTTTSLTGGMPLVGGGRLEAIMPAGSWRLARGSSVR